MFKLFLFILFILYQINCLIDYSGNLEDFGFNNELIKVGFTQNYSIEYKNYTNFELDINDNNTYRVNIHSINCNFEIDFKGKIINKFNFDTYFLKVNATNKNIKITPLINKEDGKEKENYDKKNVF